MKHILFTTVTTALLMASSASFAADSNRSTKNNNRNTEATYNKRGDDARYARTETSAGRNRDSMWDYQAGTNWNRDKFRAYDSSASAYKNDVRSFEPNDSGVGTEEASAYPKHNATAN